MPLQDRGRSRSRAILVLLPIGMALFVAGATAWKAAPKAAPEPQNGVADKNVGTDDLQRSLRLDTYRILADSGAARGENIYFYKCWMCHNQYANIAPLLKDLC